MKDLNETIDDLIIKYRIDRHQESFQTFKRAFSLASEMYREMVMRDDVIIVGDSKTDVDYFYHMIAEKEHKCYVYPDQIKEIEEASDAIVFFVSDGNIDNKCTGAKIVYLYDYLRESGLKLYKKYYEVYEGPYYGFYEEETEDYYLFDINRVFFDHRIQYECVEDIEEKIIALEKCIFDLAYARDFVQLEMYIRMRGELCGPDNNYEYTGFLNDVNTLLHEVKSMLRERNRKDFVMIWLDALDWGMDVDMPFLSSIKDKCAVFDRMFTTSPNTNPTYRLLFGGKRVVEEQSYRIKEVDDSYAFFGELKKRSINFHYHGTCKPVSKKHRYKWFYCFHRSISEICWNVLNDLACSEKSLFVVLHELTQTHPTFTSLGIKGNVYYHREPGRGWARSLLNSSQRVESRMYVDSQLEFFDSFLPESTFRLFMSDHGLKTVHNHHCFFELLQQDIVPGMDYGVRSYFDFKDIVLHFIDGGQLDTLPGGHDHVFIQDIPHYNKDEDIGFMRNLANNVEYLVGYQGVATYDDIYIKYNSGAIRYAQIVKKTDKRLNERLRYLDSLISRTPIEFTDELRYAEYILDGEINAKKREDNKLRRKWQIIHDMMSGFEETDIVGIRGGGDSTLRLLLGLDDRERERISYVVDCDTECLASFCGVPVCLPEQANDLGLSVMVIASYDLRTKFREHLRDFRGTVIDIYDLFEKNGIICNREFYWKDYSEEDFALAHNREPEIFQS